MNLVDIVASDNFNNTTIETVTLNYTSGNIWQNPYAIDWNSVTEITDVAQIIDGSWEIQNGKIH